MFRNRKYDIPDDLEGDLSEILGEHDNPSSPEPSPRCLAHSGFVAGLKFIARDQSSQWDVIRSIDRRMWTILFSVCGTFGLVLLQILIGKP